jgi:hypothetical protein
VGSSLSDRSLLQESPPLAENLCVRLLGIAFGHEEDLRKIRSQSICGEDLSDLRREGEELEQKLRLFQSLSNFHQK